MSPNQVAGARAVVAGGAMRLISKTVLAASTAAPFTFSGIPQSFNHLLMIALIRSTRATEEDTPLTTFNGDTGAHYYTTGSNVNNNAIAAFRASGQANIGSSTPIGIPGAAASAGVFGILKLEIPGYAVTTTEKMLTPSWGYFDTAATANEQGQAVTNWTQVAAISSIAINLGTGPNFAAGSAFYLYGIT